jgi:enterochelin esterase family protein
VDCGTRDEHGLIWGARTVATKLRAAGAEPVYQEFDDGHMNVGYRYDCSLPQLVRAL